MTRSYRRGLKSDSRVEHRLVLQATGETPLNAITVPGSSKGSVARDSAGYVSLGSAGGLQCSRKAVPEAACGFCFMLLVGDFIRCSASEEKFHSETLCVGIEEKIISVLLEDKVGAVNFCCCECKMIPGGSRVGAVGDVSAGHAQLLRIVGCLVNEVHSLKDYNVAACVDQDRNVVNGKQRGKVNRDVNFSRDEIFNEVREVNERDKHKCSIILRGFDCNSVTV